MYKFSSFSIFNKITGSINRKAKQNHPDLDVKEKSLAPISNSYPYYKYCNLSKEQKLYQASQSIYQQNVEPDIKCLAKSLIYIDDARTCRLSGHKKLKKIAYRNAVNSYLNGVNNHLSFDNIAAQTRNTWKYAGKYSYAKGRSVTAGGHLAVTLHNLAYSIFTAVKDAGISSAFSFAGPIATLIGSVLYRPLGDAAMGLMRPHTKAAEEVYSKFGFPRLNNSIEKSNSIAEAITAFKQVDFNIISCDIDNLIKKINSIKNHKNSHEIIKLKTQVSEIYTKISEANTKIQHLRATRGREKIEFAQSVASLKINSAVTAGNIIASSIGSASVIFAPAAAPFIKLGAGITTFGLTLTQYILNSYLSGRNLIKKFDQTIYENLKSELGVYYKQGKCVDDIKEITQKYEEKLQFTQDNYAIKKLTKKYENELKNMINWQSMTSWWQKPSQRSINIANNWIDAKIQEKLYDFLNIRIKYIEKEAQVDIHNHKKLEKIALELQNFLYDKEIVGNLMNSISLNQNTSANEISKILKLAKNPEILDIFVNEKTASKCMHYSYVSQTNNRLRDISSYFGPGFLTSLLTSSIVGGFLGSELGASNLTGIAKSPAPIFAVLSAVNHSMCLSSSNNRAESEVIKHRSLNKINKKSMDRNINNIDVNIYKSSSEMIQRLKQDNDFVCEVYNSKDINIKPMFKNNISIKAGRNVHHVDAHKLHNTKDKIKFFGDMMIGGIRSPWLHYHTARKLYKNNLEKIETLSTKQIELEKLIIKVFPDFFKQNSELRRFRY